jgi:hypothetical protein
MGGFRGPRGRIFGIPMDSAFLVFSKRAWYWLFQRMDHVSAMATLSTPELSTRFRELKDDNFSKNFSRRAGLLNLNADLFVHNVVETYFGTFLQFFTVEANTSVGRNSPGEH